MNTQKKLIIFHIYHRNKYTHIYNIYIYNVPLEETWEIRNLQTLVFHSRYREMGNKIMAFKVRDSGLRKQGCSFPLRTLSSFYSLHDPSTQNAASCIQSAFHSQPNRSENTLIDTLRGKFLDDFNPVKLISKIDGHASRASEKQWSIAEYPITVTVYPEEWMTC